MFQSDKVFCLKTGYFQTLIKFRSLNFLMKKKKKDTISAKSTIVFVQNKSIKKNTFKENALSLHFFKIYSFSLFLNKITLILPPKNLSLVNVDHITNTVTVCSH